ncbi:MAG: hypothetical protein O9327_02320 [Polaromonas sp.]|nr:hypothetical protein [Polaromonas sp.]
MPQTSDNDYALTAGETSKGTPYWSVGFTRAGVPYEKRFYGPKHGGLDAAKQAATAWRDHMLATVPALSKLEFCQIARSNSPAEIPGVVRSAPKRQPDGIWQARLKIAGQRAQVESFSVRRYGEDQAYELAVQARKRMLAAADDEPFLHAEQAKRLAPALKKDA